jgi:hypothetical protein
MTDKWGWGVLRDNMGRMHVVPSPFAQHQLSLTCWCEPTEDAGIILHSPTKASPVLPKKTHPQPS